MKIAVISSSFFESTFPLAKHLDLNHEVTLYCFLNQSLLNPPMLNLVRLNQTGVLSDTVTADYLPEEIKAYIANTQLIVKIVVCGDSNKIGVPVLFNFIRELKRNKFDRLHFIGEEFRFNFIQFFFPDNTIIQTLHEGDLTRLTARTGKLKTLLLKLFFNKLGRNSAKLIFHSENVRNSFLFNYPLKQKQLTNVIPFGLFEIYNFIDTNKIDIDLLPGYFLYYGYIEQYKGLDVLLEAINIINKLNKDIKFVIAGRDKNGLVDIGNLHNVTFFNKFLTEAEIGLLVKNAMAVIMPYHSASQSGIPNTVFCFNVPIIASDIPGINQIVKHEVNGLLFKAGDAVALSEHIARLFGDKDLKRYLADQISKENKDHDWKKLAILTADFYQS